jgi:regulatory protein
MLKGRALRLLARREHTRRELEQKLAPHVEDPGELTALLDDLSARGFISESRVVEQLVHSRGHRYGPARIRQLLTQRGVPDEVMQPALSRLKDGEIDAARALWLRKFGAEPRNTAERAKQIRFLQARGFSLNAAMRVVRGEEAEA